MKPIPELNPYEGRVLGVLVEKELTTPDGYPLSLNAATNGANQKSNRHPVTDWLEAEVDVALQGLYRKGLAGRVTPAGSRVEKFRHNAREVLGVENGELAILAELLMRGPQSPGELRTRVNRMAPTPTLEVLMERLAGLAERGLVQRLPPAPGSRSERYAQLVCKGAHAGDEGEALPGAVPDRGASALRAATPTAPAAPAGGLAERVQALERNVGELRAELEQLKSALGE